MITLSASAAYGFGGKQFIARVTGRDPKWGMALEFVGTKGGKRNETTEFRTDETGLFKIRNWTNKNRADEEYVLLLTVGDKLEEFSCEEEDATKISKALAEGRSLDSVVEGTADGYVMVTKKQEKAQVAATIDSATEACWQVLQALPESHAKKVLAALRVRVSPPKPKDAVQLTEDTPVGIVSDAAQEAGVPPEQLGLTPTPVAEDTASQSNKEKQ